VAGKRSSPVALASFMWSSTWAWQRWRASRCTMSGSAELVMTHWWRQPSGSNSLKLAPGWGSSLRQMALVPSARRKGPGNP